MSRLPRLAPGAGLNQVKEYLNLLAAAIDAGGLQNLNSVTDTGITGQGLTPTFPASPGSTNPLPGSSGTPNTPTGLQLSYGIDNYHQTHDGYIVISWTPNPVADNIARYDIFWRKGSDANLHQLTVGGDVNLARINSVIPGLSYTFAIQAHDTAGRASQFSLEQSITLSLDVDPPAIPTGLAATAIGPSIVLTWTEVGSEGISNDLKQYQIAVSTDGGSTYPTLYTVGPGNYWIYDPTVATPFFKIASVDWTGNVSAFSSAVSATAGGTIFGPLEIASGSTWTNAGWSKQLRLDNIGAIELGGGNTTKFGISANSSNMYFFTTTVEDASAAPSYWLITTTGGLPTFQKLTAFAAGASVTGGTTTDTLHATSTSALDGAVTSLAGITGTTLSATGAASLGSPRTGRFIGEWTTAGAPTGLTANIGDFGFDGNRLGWMYDGTEWIGQNQVLDAIVATSQTTTSTTYTDLATSGPAVTIETGTKVLVSIYGFLSNGTINSRAWMGFAISGATTLAAADNFSIEYLSSGVSGAEGRIGATFQVTGLTAGSNTFTAKYKSQSGTTSTFADRRIIVQTVSG